jgi:hypothetical protein
MSKPLKKISMQMPTLEEDQLITAAAESDPDALPLTDERDGPHSGAAWLSKVGESKEAGFNPI